MSLVRWTSAAALAVIVLVACTSDAPEAAGSARATAPTVSAMQRVPTLVDLGAGKCIPCKAMAPILEQLRADYAGRMDVRFIDVWKEPEQGRAYGIDMIPTQIFYAADGRELARHEGFIARDEILAQWQKLGIAF